MPFPATWQAFVLLWAIVAVPAVVLLQLYSPEWLTIAGPALAIALLAGGLKTLFDMRRN